jgi:hypothetical protein
MLSIVEQDAQLDTTLHWSETTSSSTPATLSATFSGIPKASPLKKVGLNVQIDYQLSISYRYRYEEKMALCI